MIQAVTLRITEIKDFFHHNQNKLLKLVYIKESWASM